MLNRHFFCDTGRYYPRANALEKYTAFVVNNAPSNWTIGTFGREGRYGHRLGVGGAGPPYEMRFVKTLSPSNNYAITSFAFRRDVTQSNSLGPQNITLASIYNVNTCLASLAINQDGTLSVLRGTHNINGGDVRGTSGAAMAVGSYGHIEWRTKCGTGTSGESTIWINGSQVLNLTGQDFIANAWTAGSWGPNTTGIQFSMGITTANHDYCDIILRDGSVRIPIEGVLRAGTDPWGDTRVICLLSQAGNGFYTGWTPSSGSDHGAMVDDTQEDGDATYNSTATVDARDSYEMEDLPTNIGDVLAVQIVSAARKQDPGTAFLKGFVRIAGVDYDGDHTNGVGQLYQHILSPLVTHDGQSFTVAEINACQSGPLLVHATTGDDDGGSNTGNPGDPPDPTPPPGSPPCSGLPSTSLPSWFRDAIIAAGATNCYNANIFEAVEGVCNANGGAPQRESSCQIRPRIYFGPLTKTFCGHPMVDFANPGVTHKDIESSTGEWQWV
ncbi:MAG TPA: hypothetical protein VFO16_24120 [Pseudonocardiaceae bacterium]|nr:hypothetical protein [Pseudonocardiaceae bacterium]